MLCFKIRYLERKILNKSRNLQLIIAINLDVLLKYWKQILKMWLGTDMIKENKKSCII